MWRFSTMLLLALGLWAQSRNFELFEQAPPHIEQALRERVTQFYDLSMQGKFAQIMKTLVADDSLDTFLTSDKIKYRSFKIIKIIYSENFTKARVVADCGISHFFMGIGETPLNMAFTTFWKVIDGQWYWYTEPFDPKVGRPTPFGNMHRGQDPERNSAGGPSAQALLMQAPTIEQIQSSLKANRLVVDLKSHEPSEGEVTLTNHFPGEVTLTLEKPDFPGLSLSLDKEKLQSGESAKLKASYKPVGKSRKADLQANISVEPTRQVLGIVIKFAMPPVETTAAK